MTRLAIFVVGLAAAAALAFGAGAFALYVWPEQAGAPSLSPRYDSWEAIEVVKASLPYGAACGRNAARWGAEFNVRKGKWLVAASCIPGEGPVFIAVSEGEPVGAAAEAQWSFFEDSGQVIPLSDGAADLMRP